MINGVAQKWYSRSPETPLPSLKCRQAWLFEHLKGHSGPLKSALFGGRFFENTRKCGGQVREMRRHDPKVVARHSFYLELLRQTRPDGCRIGWEVGRDCRPYKVYFSRIKSGPIAFQSPVIALAKALQSQRGASSIVVR